MSDRIILMTGANRGIGFAILQALASSSPSDRYILASRSISAGEEALSNLRTRSIQSAVTVLQLDVTSDTPIKDAVKSVENKFGRLDVFNNNAGIAIIPTAPDKSDLRKAYNSVYDTNLASVAMMMSLFHPLLRRSSTQAGGLVINISSARGSMTLGITVGFPPTVSIAYSISKTALNALTLEYAKTEEKECKDPPTGVKSVRFHVISPGHCKTEFNGYRGTRDPLDGARVVVALVNEEDGEEYGMFGFWQMNDSDRKPQKVPF